MTFQEQNEKTTLERDEDLSANLCYASIPTSAATTVQIFF